MDVQPNTSHLVIGQWYRSKNGSLCRLETLPVAGEPYVEVTSALSGYKLKVPFQETMFFTLDNPPSTKKTKQEEELKQKVAARLKLKEEKIEQKTQETKAGDAEYYSKYPHVVPESIYVDDTGKRKCVIKCVTCGNTREIKTQDAFQVKYCLECKGKVKKKKDNEEQ